jgi:hypothetical protein
MIANAKLSKGSANKVFPVSEAQDIADASEGNKEGSLNLGFKAVLLEGKPGYKIKLFAGSDLYKRLRTFNNQTIRIVEYDANGVFWGVKSNNLFKGFQAKIFFTGNKIATGQNVEEGIVEASVSILSTSEYFDNAYWMETASGGNVEDIVPLLDVNLTYVSKASNVYKIKAEVPGSNLIGPYNIYDADAGTTLTAIAALAANFSAGTGTNYGTSLAITSIAVDATLKCLTVTFDSTAFTSLSSGAAIKLTPPTPAQLDGGNVRETEEGVQGITLQHQPCIGDEHRQDRRQDSSHPVREDIV